MIYLVFMGGWCLGFGMAFVTVYDHYNKRLAEWRVCEHLRGREAGYADGLAAGKARAEKEKSP
jgi:hypothetical protein